MSGSRLRKNLIRPRRSVVLDIGSKSISVQDCSYHLYSVDPFFRFACRPNEEQILHRSTDRQLLGNHDYPAAACVPDEFRKLFGHGLAIVRDQHSPCLRC